MGYEVIFISTAKKVDRKPFQTAQQQFDFQQSDLSQNRSCPKEAFAIHLQEQFIYLYGSISGSP